MKKYILSLIFIAFNMVAFSSEIEVSSFNTPIRRPKVSVSFYVGRPIYNCEQGVWICHFQGSIGRPGGDGRQVSAEVTIENGVLKMSILKNYMTDKMEKELAEMNYYPIDDEVPIPQDILNNLGLKGSYSISVGRYKILENDEYFEVDFSVK
ncbi:MAG: hypothetical protein ABI772_07395 [Bacteroidota bacterium]